MQQDSKEYSEFQSNLKKELWKDDNSPYRTEGYKKRLSEARKEWWNSLSLEEINEIKKKIGKINKGRKFTKEHKNNLSKSVKESYKKDPELLELRTKHLTKIANDFSEQTSKRMTKNNPMDNMEFRKKALKERGKTIEPTRFEKRIIRLIQKNGLPFRFVGNFQYFINGKTPDFINEKKKICIECNDNPCKARSNWYMNKRKKELVDWEIIFLWEHQTDDEILKKLRGV